MMKRVVYIIFLLFILTNGCKTTEPKIESELDWFEIMRITLKDANKSAWYNSYKTLEECERDFLECKQKADESFYTPFGSIFLEMSQRIDFCAQCMQIKGYKLILVKQLSSEVKQAKTLYGGWGIAGK